MIEDFELKSQSVTLLQKNSNSKKKIFVELIRIFITEGLLVFVAVDSAFTP